MLFLVFAISPLGLIRRFQILCVYVSDFMSISDPADNNSVREFLRINAYILSLYVIKRTTTSRRVHNNTNSPNSQPQPTMSQPPPNRSQANNNMTSRLSTLPSQKPRQLSHLHSQLAQLTAHVSDLENLLRMTAVQAESMRGLGGYSGAM